MTAFGATLAAVVVSVGEVHESGSTDGTVADSAGVDLGSFLTVEAQRPAWGILQDN